MNPLLASTALGLIAAWPVGALGFALGRTVERLTEDPRPRAAAWSLAYALPAGALAATVAMTFAPIPPKAPPEPVAMEAVAVPPAPAAPARMPPPSLASGLTWSPPPGLATGLAWSLIGLSAAGLMARGWRWNQGRRRLAAIRAAAVPCEDLALTAAVRREAMRLGVQAPRVLVSDAVSEPLLAGVRRPAILLPRALIETAGAERLALVCGHELAHLRRGDNWRIPAEEALAGLFWMTPPVAALRSRMLAARESVCDQYALAGAAPEARRDYARVLVEALRMNALPAPQMTFESAFTGRERSLAALRLSAILQPQSGASVGRLGLVVALGGALTVATGAGSLALASQVRKIAPPAPEEIARIEAEAAADASDVAQAAAAQAAAEVEPLRIQVEKAAEAAAAKDVAAVERAVEAEAAATAALAALPAPAPDPRPDPHPDPHPDPRPNPQPEPRVQVEADRAAQRARLAAVAADLAQHQAVIAQAAALKALGALDVKVDVQPNVRVILPQDVIEKALRVKAIAPRAMAEPKISVKLSLRNEPPMPTPWNR
ncbi:M56 family metallopeptidase [Caulobacter sp. RHG1]|uniref:M56 family metallopeptidase n=1 Tax=Caulobacter sp. (strain RHG1) TaxID=2545762 RepID=UPI00155609D9|nr:M56 family metallopeptidase [Caulobacter sp. RHG1]NQE61035.1 hypothetical protein [Caulobacter sp. RHG1]